MLSIECINYWLNLSEMATGTNDAVAAALSIADINWNEDESQPVPDVDTMDALENGVHDEQSNDYAYIQENEEGDWRPVGAHN